MELQKGIFFCKLPELFLVLVQFSCYKMEGCLGKVLPVPGAVFFCVKYFQAKWRQKG